ncbi:MAG: Mur ligase family protein, partial [Gammaproteobacteria bacterium]
MTARVASPMRLGELFADVDRAALTAELRDVEVSDISTNSRDAVHGGLFLACAGQQSHGLDYVGDALGAGIAAVAWEPVPGADAPELPAGVAGLPVPGLGAHLGVLADRFFAGPSAELTVTGVTGTNGKSTTAYIAAQALRALDQPAGYMGTLGFGIGTDLEPSRLTTPGCIDVHRRLRQMADAGARHVVMEVSSHALDQDRVAGVRFSTAALTNISRDHLDYHGDMARYAQTKARLFLDSDIRAAVINTGNDYGTQLAQRLDGVNEAAVDVLSVALVETNAASGADARLLGHLRGARAEGIGMRLSGDFGNATLDSPLWGSFNGENLLVAAGLLLVLGSD